MFTCLTSYLKFRGVMWFRPFICFSGPRRDELIVSAQIDVRLSLEVVAAVASRLELPLLLLALVMMLHPLLRKRRKKRWKKRRRAMTIWDSLSSIRLPTFCFCNLLGMADFCRKLI